MCNNASWTHNAFSYFEEDELYLLELAALPHNTIGMNYKEWKKAAVNKSLPQKHCSWLLAFGSGSAVTS